MAFTFSKTTIFFINLLNYVNPKKNVAELEFIFGSSLYTDSQAATITNGFKP